LSVSSVETQKILFIFVNNCIKYVLECNMSWSFLLIKGAPDCCITVITLQVRVFSGVTLCTVAVLQLWRLWLESSPPWKPQITLFVHGFEFCLGHGCIHDICKIVESYYS